MSDSSVGSSFRTYSFFERCEILSQISLKHLSREYLTLDILFMDLMVTM